MPQNPAKNMTVTVSWEPYKTLKDKAINENTNIKTILDEIIERHLEEDGDQEAPSSEKIYTCPECGEEWETKKQLRAHMLGAHDWSGEEEEIDYELKNV